jgi:hypothetical protein
MWEIMMAEYLDPDVFVAFDEVQWMGRQDNTNTAGLPVDSHVCTK